MRIETVVRGVSAVVMLAFPLGCGSSASPGGSTGNTDATTSGGSSTGGGTTGGATTTGGTTTGVPIPGLGATCTYNVNTGLDTCAKDNLECTSLISWVFCEGLDYPCPPTDSRLGGPGTCALPQEIGPCSPDVGCQDAGTSQDGESDQFVCATNSQGSACFYSCSHSSDCANITETCQTIGSQSVCTYNYCSPDHSGKYFNTCDDLGTGDGQCLSWGGGAAAVCYQNGTVAAGQACHTYRTNGSGNEQCVLGQFCAPTPADQTVGFCMELADGTANHPCSDSKAHLVVDVIGADFGVCAQDCAADAGSCPPNLTCRTIEDGKACLP